MMVRMAEENFTIYDDCLAEFDAMGAYLDINIAALREGLRLAASESPS